MSAPYEPKTVKEPEEIESEATDEIPAFPYPEPIPVPYRVMLELITACSIVMDPTVELP
jgi:hypothetical protein